VYFRTGSNGNPVAPTNNSSSSGIGIHSITQTDVGNRIDGQTRQASASTTYSGVIFTQNIGDDAQYNSVTTNRFTLGTSVATPVNPNNADTRGVQADAPLSYGISGSQTTVYEPQGDNNYANPVTHSRLDLTSNTVNVAATTVNVNGRLNTGDISSIGTVSANRVSTGEVDTRRIQLYNADGPAGPAITGVAATKAETTSGSAQVASAGYVNEAKTEAINASKSYTDSQISIANQKAKSYAAGAGAGALAVVSAPADGGLGAALYNVGGQSAIAVGVRAPVYDKVSVSATVSKTRYDTSGGVGVGWKW
jgi:hypothetical protein